ncbi:branched-chain amino acid transport system II carrier protein [Finegoldia magna]|uniref:Branched-chain amino acid transport system carrier protein n=1 Tax=Finegoldia magna (strain ATCC 29328 / DSM 20472 / WAL 2508) TaxID=334413 RepID=B0S2W0_FINM2|nr:branched-chain amino acid transport system II carrier protein [Finegoldia magna]UEA69954.1 branched-chain amino acid transport system II carrier protein [Finegoldia magna]BAG08700.1 branched-chain amino acid transporter [Finegoldia magna ATCC 29328]
MKKSLTRAEMLTVSLMLFGMFFGAGNLIFPPMLGKLSGGKVWISLSFFCITAVVFPILGTLVVAKTKGLTNLAKKVSPMFALIFPMLIYLSIGPGLGIPRAATLPFEMAFKPYLPESFNVNLARFLYTCAFFGCAYWLALNPKKIVKRSGKFLTPALLTLITLLFVGVLSKKVFMPMNPSQAYMSSPHFTGFLEGYNTMDTIAALNFGLVISLAIRAMNINNDKDVLTYTKKGGVVAGAFLVIIYTMLSFVGYSTAGLFPKTTNGAEILTNVARFTFGSFGAVLLASIFTLACLTTCIGLITSVSQYFFELTNKMTYRKWATLWTVTALVVSNFGLNTILKLSVPVLSAIYPVSLVLIVLSLSENLFKKSTAVYKWTSYVTVFVSVVSTVANTLEANKISIGAANSFLNSLPLYKEGMVWVIPAFFTMFVGCVLVRFLSSNKENLELELENQ